MLHLCVVVLSWDRKNNPEPWNKMAPTDQYKVGHSVFFRAAVGEFYVLESSARFGNLAPILARFYSAEARSPS